MSPGIYQRGRGKRARGMRKVSSLSGLRSEGVKERGHTGRRLYSQAGWKPAVPSNESKLSTCVLEAVQGLFQFVESVGGHYTDS